MNRSVKKASLVISILIFVVWGGEELLRRKLGGFGGSYPFVETWELNISESKLIEKIKQLKEENPNLQPPNQEELIGEKSSHWLFIDFYYKDTKQIVHTWIRPAIDKSKTTFAFYSLTDLDNPSQTVLINRDFWYIPNKIEINKFRKTFVSPLRMKIK